MHRLIAALLLTFAMLASPARAADICPSGTTPASLREEGYCTAQLALRSTIARSLGMLEMRMATGDGAFAAQLRTAQDLRDQRGKLAAARREALADKDAGGRARFARISAESDKVETALAAIETQIRREHPQWIELSRPSPMSGAETSKLLRRGEVMLFWYPTEDATFVWTITSAGTEWSRIPIGATALAERIAAFRDGLGVDGPTRSGIPDRAAKPFDRAAAASLYTLLFPPAVDAKVRQADNVILVPTGSLTSLPFAALPMGERPNAPWLGLTKPLSLLPSPAGLRTLRGYPRASTSRIPFAGFGAPALAGSPVQMRGAGTLWRGGTVNGQALAMLPSLPQAAGELYDLAGALGASRNTVLIGAYATETAVKNADLSRVRVLAFATHGLVAGEIDGLTEPALAVSRPSSSSLAIAGGVNTSAGSVRPSISPATRPWVAKARTRTRL
ncbi:MAG: CHAT domain-containing protein, partial [Sphingomonadales bacterium]